MQSPVFYAVKNAVYAVYARTRVPTRAVPSLRRRCEARSFGSGGESVAVAEVAAKQRCGPVFEPPEYFVGVGSNHLDVLCRVILEILEILTVSTPRRIAWVTNLRRTRPPNLGDRSSRVVHVTERFCSRN